MGLLLVCAKSRKSVSRHPAILPQNTGLANIKKEALSRASRRYELAPVYKPDSVIGSHLSGTGVATGL